MAKDYFQQNNVAFEEYDVQADVNKRQEMVAKSGQMGVPVIVIGDEIVVGFDKPFISTLLGL